MPISINGRRAYMRVEDGRVFAVDPESKKELWSTKVSGEIRMVQSAYRRIEVHTRTEMLVLDIATGEVTQRAPIRRR